MSKASRNQNEKTGLQRLTQDMNLADHPAHQATFRFMDKAWNRTGKHLRKALEDYGQEETELQNRHAK